MQLIIVCLFMYPVNCRWSLIVGGCCLVSYLCVLSLLPVTSDWQPLIIPALSPTTHNTSIILYTVPAGHETSSSCSWTCSHPEKWLDSMRDIVSVSVSVVFSRMSPGFAGFPHPFGAVGARFLQSGCCSCCQANSFRTLCRMSLIEVVLVV